MIAAAQNRPRLLVMASTFPSHRGDGVPAFVLDIAREEGREFDVTVLTPAVPGAAHRETIDGIEIVRFRYFFSRWEDLADGAILDNLTARKSRWLQVLPLLFAQAMALRRLVRQQHPAAIHAHWVIPQGLIAFLVARRVPLLVTTHGGDIYALSSPLITRIKAWVLRGAASVSTVNSDMVMRLREWGVRGDRLHLLPMGVHLADAAAASRTGARDTGRIVTVGRLVEKKGTSVLIDAMRHHIRDKACTLEIIGDGPLADRLKRQSRGWRVTFPGQLGRDDVLRAMGASAVFVVPSIEASSGDREGLPVVVLEAAAMGAAIVASDISGINEVLVNESSALLVPPGDAHALAEAIDRLLADPALRARLGRAAAERAADYSVERIGARYRDVVRGICVPATQYVSFTIDRRHASESVPPHV